MNTNGSFECMCNTGYTGEGTNGTCISESSHCSVKVLLHCYLICVVDTKSHLRSFTSILDCTV